MNKTTSDDVEGVYGSYAFHQGTSSVSYMCRIFSSNQGSSLFDWIFTS